MTANLDVWVKMIS